MPLTPSSRLYEEKLKNSRKKAKAKDDFAFNRNVKGNALANKKRMETSRSMMKTSEVKNTSVDEGPPSIGRPSATASNISGEDPLAVFGAYGAKMIGDIVRSPLYKYTNNPITAKISDYIFPKYNEDPRTVSLAEQQRMASGLLENFPMIGDIASIAASGAMLKEDPSLKNLGMFGLNTGLSLLNPVGGSGQVKNITKGVAGDLGIQTTKKETDNVEISLGSGWGSARGARPKPPEVSDWQEGFEPLDLNVNGRTGEMSSETYKTAKAHYGDDFPDAEIIGDTAYVTPKLKGAIDKLLKELPSNLVTPVSAKQIDKTSLDSIPRINTQYAKDSEASDILKGYNIQRVDPSVPPVTKETVDRMRGTFESDYGQAYRYDPVTGEKRITNNEHVFSVSVEALRHNFEIRQLEAAMKADKLGYLARQQKMDALVKKQKTEMEVALDPNQSMLILSEGTNQKIVGALPAKDKMRAIGEHDPGGSLGVTVPYRSGEERNWFPNMATNTVGAYQDVVNNAARNAPGLVDVAAEGFRSDYAKLIKPLRNSLQSSKDPKLIAALEEKIKEAEEALYQKYYS